MTLRAKHFRWARTQTQTPTRPKCSWLPKAKARESILDISFDTNDDDDDVDSYT